MATKDSRLAEIKACNALAANQPYFDPEELDIRIGDRPVRWQTYQMLGQFAREKFFLSHGIDPKNIIGMTMANIYNGSRPGFAVAANLLAFAPYAYFRYCREKNETGSTDKLGEILKQSWGTPKLFMDIPADTNKIAEDAFKLPARATRVPDLNSDLYHIEDQPNGPRFTVDLVRFAEVTEPPIYTSDLPPGLQKCPARKLLIKQIWPNMIDLAVQTPAVFARHLAQLGAEVQ